MNVWKLPTFILFIAIFQFLTGVSFAQEVWLNTKTGVYHCPGTQWYANTKSGKLVAERDARFQGFRPAYGRACFAAEVSSSRQALKRSFAGSKGVTVWVNSKSRVYHCPGTRYYGGTKNGYMAEESEAIDGGNRPAYGKRCG